MNNYEPDENWLKCFGKVTEANEALITASLPLTTIGSTVGLYDKNKLILSALVASATDDKAILLPLGKASGITIGTNVKSLDSTIRIPAYKNFGGLIVDALGEATTASNTLEKINIFPTKVSAFDKEIIQERFTTKIKAIDFFTPVGRGQRISINAEAGVGKTTLIESLINKSSTDHIVLCLTGERGREVKELLSSIKSSLKLTTVIATSDEPPIRRMLAPFTATSIAEHIAKDDKDVLLVIDSITRFSRAVREVALTLGEFPISGGYPVSLYSKLPTLFERAGNFKNGSITAFYTLLTESHAFQEDPLAQEVKSLVDGNIKLCKQIANLGIYPAIDPLNSQSRLEERLATAEHRTGKRKIVKFLEEYDKNREQLIFSEKDTKKKILKLDQKYGKILSFIAQKSEEEFSFGETIKLGLEIL